MVEYSDLVYEFVDKYLSTAVECSVCKESYELSDDESVLDRFNKYFLELVDIIEKNDNCEIEEIINNLKKHKQDELNDFILFLKRSVLQNAFKNIAQNSTVDDLPNISQKFCKYIKLADENFFDASFTTIESNPSEMVNYVRRKDEFFYGNYGN